MVVLSSIVSPVLIASDGDFPLMVNIWLFPFPNCIWYLLAISFVVSTIAFSSSMSLWIRAISSIQRRHPVVCVSHIFTSPKHDAISCTN